MAETKPKFEGTVVRLGEKDYVMPALNVKQARTLWPNLLNLDRGITPENLPEKYELALPLIHAALSRNYPELKLEEVEELVDLGNIRRLLLLVAGRSGVVAGENRPDALLETAAVVQ